MCDLVTGGNYGPLSTYELHYNYGYYVVSFVCDIYVIEEGKWMVVSLLLLVIIAKSLNI